MKKAYILPIVLFVVFFVADIALIAIIENTNGTMYFLFGSYLFGNSNLRQCDT